MAAELIGRCKCPVCGSDKARLTLAKSKLCVVTCNGCNFQGFARSDRSDEALRARIVPDATPTPEPVRTETPPASVRANAAPPPPRTPSAAPVEPPTPQPEPPAPPKGRGWGVFA